MENIAMSIEYIAVLAILSGLLGWSVTGSVKHFRPEVRNKDAIMSGTVSAAITFAATATVTLYFLSISQ